MTIALAHLAGAVSTLPEMHACILTIRVCNTTQRITAMIALVATAPEC